MNQFLIILLVVTMIYSVMMLPVFAHTAKVMEDFKINIGWKNEPPIVGQENSIEIQLSLAEEYDKRTYDMIFFTKVNNTDITTTADHLSGLSTMLEANIRINGNKQFLVLEEDKEQIGVYTAKYIPLEEGTPTVHLFGIIKNLEFELTSNIEKIKQNPNYEQPIIPEWIKNNAAWWADGQIDDNTFVQGIEFLISEKIMQISNTSTQKSTTQEIPSWIKNNAKWWTEGLVTDDDFVNGLQYLAKNGIIQIN